MVDLPKNVVCGKDVLTIELNKYISSKISLIVTKTSYNMIKKHLVGFDYSAFFVKNNQLSELRKIALMKDVRNSDVIIGVGGGRAVDASKTIASISGKKLICIISVMSCNAFSTDKSVVRKNRKYITYSSKKPDLTIADYSFINSSDQRHNLAGLGEILSFQTALYDWNLAVLHKKEKRDDKIYATSQSAFEEFKKQNQIILNFNDSSLSYLLKALYVSGQVTNLFGSGRPESGSEHIFTRSVENDNIFYKKILHGELVTLGVLLCSELQCQNNDFAYFVAKKMNLGKILKSAGLSKNMIMHYFIRARTLRPDRFTIFNTIKLDLQRAESIVESVLVKLNE